MIEHTPILPHWEKQLQKEAQVKFVQATLAQENLKFDEETVKRVIDGFLKTEPKDVKNLVDAMAKLNELEDSELRETHKILSSGRYRNKESILAEIVALFDWYNSLDARDTHPLLVAGVFYAQIERVKPFDDFNSTIASLFAKLALKVGGYSLNGFLVFEDSFIGNSKTHSAALESSSSDDFTEWLEYYTDAIARKISNLKEKVLLLARDTKIAKASGRIDLTDRQGKVVAYLQDYGLLQNKDFGRIFPGVSEDSILRDLKVLIDKGIVVKRGSTKSSRYELK